MAVKVAALPVERSGGLDAVARFGVTPNASPTETRQNLDAALAQARLEGNRPVFLRAHGAGVTYKLDQQPALEFGDDLEGEYVYARHFNAPAGLGTCIECMDPTKPVIQAPNVRNGFQYIAGRLRGLHLKGGLDAVLFDNGAGQLAMEDMCFDSPGAQLHFKGQVQNCLLRRFVAEGGERFMYHDGSQGTVFNAPSFMDKNVIEHGWIRTQSIAAIELRIGAAGGSVGTQAFNLTLQHLAIERGAGNMIICAGNFRALRLVNINNERGAGFLGNGPRFARTVCNTVADNPQIEVPSGTALLAPGDPVNAGYTGGDGSAAQLGWDLRTTILSVDDATHVTVATAPKTTCRGVPFSRGNKSSLVLSSFGGASPADVWIESWKAFGEGTSAGSLSEQEYEFDFSGVTGRIHGRNNNTGNSSGVAYDPHGAVVDADTFGEVWWRVPRSGFTTASRRRRPGGRNAIVATNDPWRRGATRHDSKVPASGVARTGPIMDFKRGAPVFEVVIGKTGGAAVTSQGILLIDAATNAVLARSTDLGADTSAGEVVFPIANAPWVPPSDVEVIPVYVGWGTTIPTLTGWVSGATNMSTDAPVPQGIATLAGAPANFGAVTTVSSVAGSDFGLLAFAR